MVVMVREDGKTIGFQSNGASWIGSSDSKDNLAAITDAQSNTVGWRYTTPEDDVELYDANGNLQSITSRSGVAQTLTYSDGTAGPNGGYVVDANGNPTTAILPANLILRVADSYGRQLSFSYNAASNVSRLLDPSGKVYGFSYDGNNNLSSIIYPDGSTYTYLYENASFVHALTGTVDENGSRFATYGYDANTGQATSTQHAGGVENYSLAYSGSIFSGSTTVTDPLGTSRVYNFTSVLGATLYTGRSQPGGAGCSASQSAVTYDANGNVSSTTDFNGNVTNFTYDTTRNLETSRTEAYGTPVARTITTQWHPTFRLPLVVTEPNRTTTYTYDANGNQLTKTVAGGGVSRTWTYTYNSNGQVLTSTGPRTDVVELTTYTYDSNGNLSTVANAFGQTTTMSNYDGNGRVGLITAPNGATQALTYTPRGWVASSVVTAGSVVQTTTYTYDNAGQLSQVTQPDNATINYTYDSAHRLTNIKDKLGNSVNYTLDLMGNRIAESINDPNGALTKQVNRVFDALSRLQQVTGAAQ